MSSTIKTLGNTLVVDTRIRSVLCGRRWVTLPRREWEFLLMISSPKWVNSDMTTGNRMLACRLRRRIGTLHVELVRGHGYRLGTR